MQEEPLFPTTITHKLYNERAVMFATFIGGPLAGGYLLAKNFTALEEPVKAKKTWLIVIVVMILLVASTFLPVLDNVPSIVYNFIICIAAHSAATRFQGSRIALHQINGGQLHSTGRALLVGLVFLLLTVAVVVGLMYLQDPLVFQ